MLHIRLFVVLIVMVGLEATNPWDKYNFSPKNRTLVPTSSTSFPITLSPSSNSHVFDFGKEVGGSVTIAIGAPTTVPASQRLGLTFSESTYYIQNSDNSNGGSGADGALVLDNVLAPGNVLTTPLPKLRGGFRYLRVFLNPTPLASSNITVTITSVFVTFSPAPTMSNPSHYANHFFTNDDLLNRIWYGGAYTVQMSTIDPSMGRVWPPPASGWDNSASAGVGRSILVDGAKRDRMVWSGDCGVSIPTAYYSTGDVESSANAIETLLTQCMDQGSGLISMVGPPICNFFSSDTYHLWALIGTCNTFAFTQNTAWLKPLWQKFVTAVNTSAKKIGSRGLMVVDQTSDWARCCMGGENIAANSLLVNTLRCGAELSVTMGDGALAQSWNATADSVTQAVNEVLWDDVKGAFKDNPTSTLYPQDGNSIAVMYGVAWKNRTTSISNYLSTNWGKYGSHTPEWTNNIATFPGSLEVLAHMAAGQTSRALELIRRQWGYMINNPNSTQSTFWEGYLYDGQFAYQGAYMSNSHGWATGPVSALSRYVVGVDRVGYVGKRWKVSPKLGEGVEDASGCLHIVGEDKVCVEWHYTASSVDVIFTMTVNASKASDVGIIEVPFDDVQYQVQWETTSKLTLSNQMTSNVTTVPSGGVYKITVKRK